MLLTFKSDREGQLETDLEGGFQESDLEGGFQGFILFSKFERSARILSLRPHNASASYLRTLDELDLSYSNSYVSCAVTYEYCF